jgi:hypothetical protein
MSSSIGNACKSGLRKIKDARCATSELKIQKKSFKSIYIFRKITLVTELF